MAQKQNKQELKININQILKQAIDALENFKESIGTAAAIGYIQTTREKLDESWQFIKEEDKVIELVISAVEMAFYQEKWRNYNSQQIATLQEMLQSCIDGKIQSKEEFLKWTSRLGKEDIDIFPSAPEWAYEDDEG